MASTNSLPVTGCVESSDSWKSAGLRYYSYGYFMRQRFHRRVQKVSIDAGFTCPNVDGTVATGGCTFCDNRSFSPSRRLPRGSIRGQIDEGIRRLKRRYNCDQFMAYFQPATNTYGPVDRLRALFEEAIAHPQVVGLVIGTRPDCVPDSVLDLLAELAGKIYLSLEYGIQTIHDRSLEWMNRGHGYDVFPDAVARSRGRGFEICAHVILGLPGESHRDMMATATEMARLELDAIKIHNLYAVKNTPLADDVAAGKVKLMERDVFVAALVDFLERLPATMVVDRVTGEAPPDYFIGPSWCLDKPGLLQAIATELEQRNTYQGRFFDQMIGPPNEPNTNANAELS